VTGRQLRKVHCFATIAMAALFAGCAAPPPTKMEHSQLISLLEREMLTKPLLSHPEAGARIGAAQGMLRLLR